MEIPIATSAGKNLTPTMPKEPPAELKAMTFSQPPEGLMGEVQTTIKMDGQEIKTESITPTLTEERVVAKEEPVKVAEKKEVKTEPTSVIKPPKEEKKVEAKAEDKTKVGEPKSTLITPPSKKAETDTFDYSKYSNEQQQVLKQMSNVAKKEYAKVLDENKQLSSLKDATYLQHESAYTLSPEFQQLQVKTYRTQVEGQAWEQALLDIKAGKDYQEITGFNAQGQPTFQTRKATDRDEIRVNNNLAACLNATREFNGQLQQFPAQFKQRIAIDQQAINDYERNNFSWVAQPELLEHIIEVEGVGDKKIKDIISDVKNMFPVYDRNSTGARMAAHLAVGLMIRNAELKEARNSNQVANIVQQEETKIEPSSDNREVVKTLSANGVPSNFQLPSGIAEGLGIR